MNFKKCLQFFSNLNQKKIFEKKMLLQNFEFFLFSLQHIFSVLNSSETYAKKILPSALFEGGGSADR